jgi:hypothetical protein
MKIALIQQHASSDLDDNLQRAMSAFEQAAQRGAKLIGFAELALTPFYPQNRAGAEVQSLAETIPGPTTERFARYNPWRKPSRDQRPKDSLSFQSNMVLSQSSTYLKGMAAILMIPHRSSMPMEPFLALRGWYTSLTCPVSLSADITHPVTDKS